MGCENLLRKLGISEVRVFMMGRSASYEDLSEKLTMEFSMRGPLYEDVSAAYLYQMLTVIDANTLPETIKIQAMNASRKPAGVYMKILLMFLPYPSLPPGVFFAKSDARRRNTEKEKSRLYQAAAAYKCRISIFYS